MESIARVRFSWSTDLTKCRATALDVRDGVLGEVTVEFPPETARRVWSHGTVMQFRVEDIADRHLRAMLALRG